jgi:hypothetical protein
MEKSLKDIRIELIRKTVPNASKWEKFLTVDEIQNEEKLISILSLLKQKDPENLREILSLLPTRSMIASLLWMVPVLGMKNLESWLDSEIKLNSSNNNIEEITKLYDRTNVFNPTSEKDFYFAFEKALNPTIRMFKINHEIVILRLAYQEAFFLYDYKGIYLENYISTINELAYNLGLKLYIAKKYVDLIKPEFKGEKTLLKIFKISNSGSTTEVSEAVAFEIKL